MQLKYDQAMKFVMKTYKVKSEDATLAVWYANPASYPSHRFNQRVKEFLKVKNVLSL
jgi:hypothetical protein